MMESKLFAALSELGVSVYPLFAPIDARLPCITYYVVLEHKKQVIDASIYAQVQRFEVDIWSESYKEAKELKEGIVDKIISLGATDITTRDMLEKETKVYRQIIEFYIKE